MLSLGQSTGSSQTQRSEDWTYNHTKPLKNLVFIALSALFDLVKLWSHILMPLSKGWYKFSFGGCFQLLICWHFWARPNRISLFLTDITSTSKMVSLIRYISALLVPATINSQMFTIDSLSLCIIKCEVSNMSKVRCVIFILMAGKMELPLEVPDISGREFQMTG